MSVFVNVGQCGNQVGAALLDLAAKTKEKSRRGSMRCILVDSEPKVVRGINAPDAIAAIHIDQSGRGNNWAMGYNKSKRLCEETMESLRREIEATDYYRGAVLVHSLAGGTGSGLGCRILEAIRETYPKAYIASGCVAPSLRGDTPLQNYNAMFTMATLQEYADVVLYKDNDDLIRSIGYWNSVNSKTRSASVSLADMNALIAADWAGLLFPSTKEKIRRDFDIGSLVTSLCPMSDVKFVDVRSAYYYNKAKAPPLIQGSTATHQDCESLSRLLVSSFPRSETMSFGHHIVARGFRGDIPIKRLTSVMQKTLPVVDWCATSPSVDISSSPLTSQVGASMTMCSNGTNVVPTLEAFINRANMQYQACAYVHWYRKHGVDEAIFEEYLNRSRGIIDTYSSFSRSC